MEGIQWIKSYGYRSGASVCVHVRHQNGEKCDCGIVVGERWTGLSISGAVDLLGFSHRTVFCVTVSDDTEWGKKKK